MPDNYLLCIAVASNESDDGILAHMRTMKAVRESHSWQHVRCSITGYDSDPRELWDIPEVAPLCQRLVDMGFISYLDFGNVPFMEPVSDNMALGAAEVLLFAAGRMRGGETFWTRDLLAELQGAWHESNARADALVGPFTSPAASAEPS